MIKITASTLDYLMTNDLLCKLLDTQSTTFRLQFLTFFAMLQKQVADAESVSESAAAPALCPVAEQVADLTERLDAALMRLAELEAAADIHQSAISMLTAMADNHTHALNNLHDAVVQALGWRYPVI